MREVAPLVLGISIGGGVEPLIPRIVNRFLIKPLITQTIRFSDELIDADSRSTVFRQLLVPILQDTWSDGEFPESLEDTPPRHEKVA
jgi:hypothetical protein